MFGYNIAALKVYTRTSVGGPLTLVWNQNGNLGDEWLRATVALKNSQPFQVLLEGVRGAGYAGICILYFEKVLFIEFQFHFV